MDTWLVDDVMTRHVVGVHPDTPYRRIVGVLIGRRISAVPVIGADGSALGVISESDLLLKVSDVPAPRLIVTPRHRRDVGKAHARLARDLMTAPAVTVPASAPLAEAARRMQREKVKRLVVVDGDDRVVGIVTRSDLLKVHLRPDADIRHDVAERLMRRVLGVEPVTIRLEVTDGVVVLDGHVHLRSLADRAARLAAGVPGVAGVVDRIGHDVDDRLTPGSERAMPFGVA